MDIILSPIQVRILGSLIEKELATPQYYPLSLNALTNACNQKSNRHPVLDLDEAAVVKELGIIRDTKLVWKISTAGSRVPKYEHNIIHIQEFTKKEVSILCELFLRGPQTVGELRTHAARFCEFANLEEVEEVLQNLISAEKGPFVTMLYRQAGRRENRYAHLFCGEVCVDTKDTELFEPVAIQAHDDYKRIEALEHDVTALKEELADLKDQFISFKKQFE